MQSPGFSVPPLSHITPCIPTVSNLYLANSLVAAVSESDQYWLLNVPCTKTHVSFLLLMLYKSIGPGPSPMYLIRNTVSFQGEELLSLRPTPKLEAYCLSAVRDSKFNKFTSTLHIGGRYSIRNLRTRHIVVTGIHL